MNVKKTMQMTGEWYLYHNIKNEDWLLYVILFSVLAFFFKNALGWELGIWGSYAINCYFRNRELDNSFDIIRQRNAWIDVHERNGDLHLYEPYYRGYKKDQWF